MAGSVTIDDVAEKAGVSIKTVSRVVNKEPNVRDKTREKVMEAIKALNYRPNQSARGLAGRRSYLIGLLYDNPSPNYLANLQAGVLAACQEVSYGLALSPVSFGDPDLIDSVIAWMRQSAIDGVLLTPPLSDSVELVAAIKAEGVPSVIVSSVGPGGVPAVVIDEKEASRQMAMHLIEAGHTVIGFIKGHPDHYASAHRFAGFEQAMTEAGLKVDPSLVKQGYFDFDSGKAAGEELINAKNRPTAVFASNDDMAAAAISAAHMKNIQVPTALSVVGFDDTLLASTVWPHISTVRQPLQEMAKVAVELLVSGKFDDPTKIKKSDLRHVLDFEIIERDSSAEYKLN